MQTINQEWGYVLRCQREIYEGPLKKRKRRENWRGAVFMPWPLIQAMVRCTRLDMGKTIAAYCRGNGGFFLAAQEYIADLIHCTLDWED